LEELEALAEVQRARVFKLMERERTSNTRVVGLNKTVNDYRHLLLDVRRCASIWGLDEYKRRFPTATASAPSVSPSDRATTDQQVLDAINTAAGPMLGREYAARYLPAASKSKAESVAKEVRDALARGIRVIEPVEGDMACGEYGPGRLPEPVEIMNLILPETSRGGGPAKLVEGVSGSESNPPPLLERSPSPANAGQNVLRGKHILVTAGPTHEPIDPVRIIANRSSGKQGFAIAAAAAAAGARVTLVAGPVALPTPGGVARIDVETAEQMAQAVEAALPCDAAVLVAAVADWKVKASLTKLKKSDGPPRLEFEPNPDILATLAAHPMRPALLVGFAAETQDLAANAAAKRQAKGADWIVANDVSGTVMGGSHNQVRLVTADGFEEWEEATKEAVAAHLVSRIAETLRTRGSPDRPAAQ